MGEARPEPRDRGLMGAIWQSASRLGHGAPTGIPLDCPGSVTYKLHMFELRQTSVFEKWFLGLKDLRAREAVAKRLVRIEAGLLGDAKPLGGGIFELRIQHGPGYRLCCARRGKTLMLLLCGGDKDSQARDVRKARRLEKEIDDEDHEV